MSTPMIDPIRSDMWDLIETRLWNNIPTASMLASEDLWEAFNRRFHVFDSMNLWIRLWDRMAENIERQIQR